MRQADLGQQCNGGDNGQHAGRQKFIIDEHLPHVAPDHGEVVHRAASRPPTVVSRTRPKPQARNISANTRIARSCPGQSSPKPSPTQNTPKADRTTPTANFSMFSGTRAKGL